MLQGSNLGGVILVMEDKSSVNCQGIPQYYSQEHSRRQIAMFNATAYQRLCSYKSKVSALPSCFYLSLLISPRVLRCVAGVLGVRWDVLLGLADRNLSFSEGLRHLF